MAERDEPSGTSGSTYLVVGASGALGGRVARRLIASGARVRAASRDPVRLASLAALGAEPVRLDLLEPGGFARVKRATERHLAASGVPWTVLRPSIYPENHALELLGAPLRAGKSVPFFGSGTEPLNWVSADDVADDVVRVLDDPAAAGVVRELRGVDRMSRLEALAVVERMLGRAARRQHLPVPVVRAVRAVARAVHPGVHVLVDLALDEIVRGGDPADEAERADAVGATKVEDVVAAWARQVAGKGGASLAQGARGVWPPSPPGRAGSEPGRSTPRPRPPGPVGPRGRSAPPRRRAA